MFLIEVNINARHVEQFFRVSYKIKAFYGFVVNADRN